MSKPRKMWALSSGSYSDYAVHALFPTKALAEEALAHADIYDPHVEEFVLYDEIPQPVILYTMSVNLLDDGRMEYAETSDTPVMPWSLGYGQAKPRPSVSMSRRKWERFGGTRLYISGSDLTAVQKTYSDRVAQWRAELHLRAAAQTKTEA